MLRIGEGLLLVLLGGASAVWGPSEALEQHHEERKAIDLLQTLHERGNLRRGSVPLPHAPDDEASVHRSLAMLKEPSAEALRDSLTRRHGVSVSADVRGNLGPPSVMVQQSPGTNWLKDRWQAASDMGGTAIPGRHWVVIDLGRPVAATSLVLDWEAAYASKYKIEVRSTPPADGEKDGSSGWRLLFDASEGDASAAVALSGRRVSRNDGTSPGVPGGKVPLHVIHTVQLLEEGQKSRVGDTTMPFQYLRVLILKPAMGWGVSLWQLDLVGFDVTY